MKRSMMQVYVIKSDEAVALYQKAFDATLLCNHLNCSSPTFLAERDIEFGKNNRKSQNQI